MDKWLEDIRGKISCPQFADDHYGEWGALRLDQRRTIKRMLDFIQGQEEKIKLLTRYETEFLKERLKTEELEERLGEVKAENERLKAKVNHYNYCYENFVNTPISRIKAEAYKECIEKVKEISSKTGAILNETHWEDKYTITEGKLDNLLKELVGEDK